MLRCCRSILPADPDERDGHFEKLAASGWAGVEIVFPEQRLSQSALTPSGCRSWLQAAEKHAIRICSITTDGLDVFDLADASCSHQKASLGGFERLLQAAAWLEDGTGLVIGAHEVHGVQDIAVGDYEQAFNTAFVSVESLVRQAEKSGVDVNIENPGGGLFLSPLELREFLDEINSPHVGLCFNPAHASYVTDPLDWFSIMDRHIRAVRLPLCRKEKPCDVELHDEILQRLDQMRFEGPVAYIEPRIPARRDG